MGRQESSRRGRCHAPVRSLEERHRLLAGFTDIVVEVLGVDRNFVRGGIVPVQPENWSIGGEPGSVRRRDEIAARAILVSAKSS